MGVEKIVQQYGSRCFGGIGRGGAKWKGGLNVKGVLPRSDDEMTSACLLYCGS